MTQPLLAGIVTALGGPRAGQAMGRNVFLLFTGFGLGSVVFGGIARHGVAPALVASESPSSFSPCSASSCSHPNVHSLQTRGQEAARHDPHEHVRPTVARSRLDRPTDARTSSGPESAHAALVRGRLTEHR